MSPIVFKPTLFNTVKIIEDYTSKNLLKLPNYNIEIKSKPVTDSVFHPGVQEFSDIVLSFEINLLVSSSLPRFQ